jgi:peptidoglycan/LPS O-acetylase OafA/YrhL
MLNLRRDSHRDAHYPDGRLAVLDPVCMPQLHRRRWPVLLALLLTFLSACAPGDVPPAAICDTYNRALFTTQLLGGAAVLLGLAVLGFRKNLSAILPSQSAQLGAVAGSVFLGLILLAFSSDIGNQILIGFGIESLYTLCGLG